MKIMTRVLVLNMIIKIKKIISDELSGWYGIPYPTFEIVSVIKAIASTYVSNIEYFA